MDRLDLRSYQQEAVATILSAWQQQLAALAVLPTGTGKTVIFSEVIRLQDCRTLLIAHREELLKQARDKLHQMWPGADVGIVGAGFDEPLHQITIGSVQSLSRPKRLEWLAQEKIRLVIIDEAHHTPAVSYRKVLQSVGFPLPEDDPLAVPTDESASPRLLGVTATPERADGYGLDPIYGAPIFIRMLPEMVRDGWLCDLRGLQISTNVNLDEVHTRLGDFAEDELAAAVNLPDRNQIIVEAYQNHAATRPTLVFAVNVAHAYDLAECFRATGIEATALDGESSRQVRAQTLAQFAAGKIKVLCNCALFTEGIDLPQTACVILARPTKSRTLYCQEVGRGTRTAPGKSNCLVIDIADVSRRHSLFSLPRLIGREGYPETEEKSISSGFSLREEMNEELPQQWRGMVTERDVDLLPQWKPRGDGNYHLDVQTQGGQARAWLVLKDNGYVAGIVWPDGYKQQLTISCLPLGWAQSVAEQSIAHLMSGRPYLVDDRASWRTEPATEFQLKKLRKLKIRVPSDITKGQASELISQAMGRQGAVS